MNPWTAYIVTSEKGNWHVPQTFNIYEDVCIAKAEEHFNDTWDNLYEEGYRIRKIEIREVK